MGKTRRKNRPHKGLGTWKNDPYEIDNTIDWDKAEIPKTWIKKKGKKKRIQRIDKLDDLDVNW